MALMASTVTLWLLQILVFLCLIFDYVPNRFSFFSVNYLLFQG